MNLNKLFFKFLILAIIFISITLIILILKYNKKSNKIFKSSVNINDPNTLFNTKKKKNYLINKIIIILILIFYLLNLSIFYYINK